MKRPKTLRELKASGYRSRSTKTELRENLIEQIRAGKSRWPGIIGYERTVLPLLENSALEQLSLRHRSLSTHGNRLMLRHYKPPMFLSSVGKL